MKRLKRGPDLKLPSLRVPGQVRDLWRDLDDRHLIPVVIVLVAATVAIPLLLSGSSEAESGASGGARALAVSTGSTVKVSEATPRLRDYKIRLAHLKAHNPFGEPAPEEESGAGSSSPSDEGGSTSVESTTGPESPTSTSETSGGSTSSETSSSGSSETLSPEAKLRYFSYAIDVRVVPVSVDGKSSEGEAVIRKDLAPWTMLPSREIPALTYIGPTKDGKKAIMLVSSDVTSLFGESKCVVGSESCQLLALEEGAPETVVFGPKAKTYRIELRKISLISTESLNVSSLGGPKRKQAKKSGSGKTGIAPEPRNSLSVGIAETAR